MVFWGSCRCLRLPVGFRGSGAGGTARNAWLFLVAVTHPKNSYSSRTPCSSLLPLLSAHAAAGRQGSFARKPSGHGKPSEGKAPNPKLASSLPSPADSSHQAVPAHKQVSGWGGPRCPQGPCTPCCSAGRGKPLACRGGKEHDVLDAEPPGVTPRLSHPSSTAWPHGAPWPTLPAFRGAVPCGGSGILHSWRRSPPAWERSSRDLEWPHSGLPRVKGTHRCGNKIQNLATDT